jgi:hypothetical protein
MNAEKIHELSGLIARLERFQCSVYNKDSNPTMYVESEKIQKSEFENVEQFAEDLRVAIETVVNKHVNLLKKEIEKEVLGIVEKQKTNRKTKKT